MGERKPISKKIRFEVFKRDKFTCQYCGRTIPDVTLHVDHIKPVAKGGKNDIMNLITSCSDCNLGKGARELSDDSVVKKQQKQIQELADRNEQLEMLLKWREELQSFESKEIDIVNSKIGDMSAWMANDIGKAKLKDLIKRFSIQVVLDAVDIAFDKYYDGSEKSWQVAFDKIGGICHNKTRADGNKMYYFNYLRKVCSIEFGYSNTNTLTFFIDNYIKNDDDFEEVKYLLKSSRNWSDFRNRVEEEFGDYEGS